MNDKLFKELVQSIKEGAKLLNCDDTTIRLVKRMNSDAQRTVDGLSGKKPRRIITIR